MIMKTIGFRGTLFSDTPILIFWCEATNDDSLGRYFSEDSEATDDDVWWWLSFSLSSHMPYPSSDDIIFFMIYDLWWCMMMYDDVWFELFSIFPIYQFLSSQFPASPSQLRMSDTRGDVSDFSMWSEDEELIDPSGNLKSNSARRWDSQRGIRCGSKGCELKNPGVFLVRQRLNEAKWCLKKLAGVV